ncbi:MAG: hypothetical protein RIC38_03320 [Chromatocurvus sp.]
MPEQMIATALVTPLGDQAAFCSALTLLYGIAVRAIGQGMSVKV